MIPFHEVLRLIEERSLHTHYYTVLINIYNKDARFELRLFAKEGWGVCPKTQDNSEDYTFFKREKIDHILDSYVIDKAILYQELIRDIMINAMWYKQSYEDIKDVLGEELIEDTERQMAEFYKTLEKEIKRTKFKVIEGDIKGE